HFSRRSLLGLFDFLHLGRRGVHCLRLWRVSEPRLATSRSQRLDIRTAPDRDQRLLAIGAKHEIVRRNILGWHELEALRQDNLRLAGSPATPLALLRIGCRHRWYLRRIDLTDGRLDADTLAVAFDRLGNFRDHWSARIVVK